MIKKFLLLSIPFMLFAVEKPFSLGLVVSDSLGLHLNYDRFKSDIYNNKLSVDHYIQTFSIEKNLSWYYAGGLGFVWGKSSQLNARLPVGVQWDFAKKWDLFSEAVPTLTLSNGISFGLDYTLGVRYSF